MHFFNVLVFLILSFPLKSQTLSLLFSAIIDMKKEEGNSQRVGERVKCQLTAMMVPREIFRHKREAIVTKKQQFCS